jgi:predicted transcriptional regulator YheO
MPRLNSSPEQMEIIRRNLLAREESKRLREAKEKQQILKQNRKNKEVREELYNQGVFYKK